MTGIPVLVSLGATQTADNGQSEAMQLLTSGELTPTENGYLLRYEETLDETAPPTKIELSLMDGVVRMQREGLYAADMVFRKGQRYEGQYTTPFGTMELAIFCTKAHYTIDENGGAVSLHYQLDLNGQYASMHELDLRFVVKEGEV